MKIYLFTLFLTLVILTHSDTYIKEINKADSQALCLDNQPAFLYFQQGAPTPSEGLILHFLSTPSSSFCGNTTVSQSLDSCINLQTEISSYWNNSLSITTGILTDPFTSGWGKVIIPYCDGALFQGYTKIPTSYKGKLLYFRGSRIMKSNLDQISKKFNISKLGTVILSGSGMGGVGAMIWARYFHDEIVMKSSNIKYKLIVDSYPQSYLSFKTGKNQYQNALKNMIKLTNVDEPHPFLLCSLRNEGQQQKCFNFEEIYQYLNFPIFSLQSQYDPLITSKILQINCINKGSLSGCSNTQRQYLQKYRTNKLVSNFKFTNFHDSSFWLIACPANNFLGDNYNSNMAPLRGDKINQAVQDFVFGARSISFDRDPWPSNSGCVGQ